VLTPEAKLWPAQSPLLEKLLQLVYGNEGLDYMAKKQLAEGPRESAPFSMSAELPGANPEASTPPDAMFGLAMSGGGLPGEVSRAFAPQIERAAMAERKPPSVDPAFERRPTKEISDPGFERKAPPFRDQGFERATIPGIASPDLIAALMEATRATPETAPTARRPENNWQLGFPREGQSRPFAEQKYRFELPVRVTWPDGTSHTDVVKGLNASHALKRAQFNWEGAKIEPLTSRPEFVNNASAESGSGASAEALSRTSSMATRGQKFMIRDRAGNFRPATEDGAMSLRPGESFGIMGPFGFDVQSSKGDQPTVSPKMRARNTYSADGTGRHFTEKGLEDYRRDLSAQLRSEGKVKTAESYERMSIRAFAAQGGYVIVDK
jgi:hypothetical protein